MHNNNASSFSISGRRESIKALVIDTLPRWEYRFIRNALYRDPGVNVHTLLFHPALEEIDVYKRQDVKRPGKVVSSMSWIIPQPCVPGWVPTLILALNSSCATIFSIPGAGIPGRFCSAR